MNTLRRIPGHAAKALAAFAVLVAAALPLAVATDAGAAGTISSVQSYVEAGTAVLSLAYPVSTTVIVSDPSFTLGTGTYLAVGADVPAGATLTSGVLSILPTNGTTTAVAVTLYSASATIGAGVNTGELVISGSAFAGSGTPTVTTTAPGVTLTGATEASTGLVLASYTGTAATVAGYYTVTVADTAGTSNALANALLISSDPTATSVSPASVVQGTASTAISVTGSNFVNGASLTLTNTATGVNASLSSVTWQNADLITATLATPAVGTYVATVTNPDGGTFTSGVVLTASGPSITGISPSSIALNGTTASTTVVTITGSGFVSGAYVTDDMTADAVVGAATVVSPTSITVPVTVPTTAGATLEAITVHNPDGSTAVSNSVTTGGGLGIGQASLVAPTITSVTAPTSLSEPNSATFTIFGTGFGTGATLPGSDLVFKSALGVADTSLSCGTITIISSTELTCIVTAASGVTSGAHSVTLTTTTPSNTLANAITIAGPSITSVSPAVVGIGFTGVLTFTGVGLTGATKGTITDGAAATGALSVTSSTSATLTLTTGPTAPGTMLVELNSAGSTTVMYAAITVGGSTPVVTSVTYPTGTAGVGIGAKAVPVTINGSGFLAGATVTDTTGAAGDVTVTVTSVSATTIQATVAAITGATTGTNNITVANTDGGTTTSTLTIDAGTGAITVAPTSVRQGTTATLIMTATGFVSGATVTSSSSLVTVGTVVFVSPNEIKVPVTVSALTGTSAINTTLTVANPDGGATVVPFVVNPAPSVTGTYTVASPSTNAEVVVTGTGFETGMTASSANSAYTITVGAVTAATATTPATAVLLVTTTSNAETAVTLTNPDGGTATFNLNAPAVTPPPVTTVRPHIFTTGAHGTAVVGKTVTITISGGGFYGQPSVTSTAPGTRAVVSHDSGSLLTLRVTVTSASARGEHTFTITLANGKSAKVNYRTV